jgi:hypothetical protein
MIRNPENHIVESELKTKGNKEVYTVYTTSNNAPPGFTYAKVGGQWDHLSVYEIQYKVQSLFRRALGLGVLLPRCITWHVYSVGSRWDRVLFQSLRNGFGTRQRCPTPPIAPESQTRAH